MKELCCILTHRNEKREGSSRERDDTQRRPHSPRTRQRERENTQVFMETEEEGQENRRTDRFRSERFDNPESTMEFGKDRYFSPRGGRQDRNWREDRGNSRMGSRGEWGEGPRERDFNRYRGADRGDRGRGDNYSQRLFESLTDPTEVPRLGNFFEVHVCCKHQNGFMKFISYLPLFQIKHSPHPWDGHYTVAFISQRDE